MIPKKPEVRKKRIAGKEDEEQSVMRQIPNQSFLSDYAYEVDEKTSKDTEYYAVRLKDITEVAAYEYAWISEMGRETLPRAAL